MKFAKVMFLHMSVILFTREGLPRPRPTGEVGGGGLPRGCLGPGSGGRLGGLPGGYPGPGLRVGVSRPRPGVCYPSMH